MSDAQRTEERGAALITALIMLVVLGSVSTLILERSRSMVDSTEHERSELLLFYAADGGLEHLRHSLARAADHRGAELRIGTCDVRTAAAEVSGLAGDSRRWQVSVEVLGLAAGGAKSRCRLEAVLRPGKGLPVVEFRRRR